MECEVRPVDVNYSQWDNTLEEKINKYHVIRLGFRQVKGMSAEEIQALISGRVKNYTSIPQLLDAGVSQAALEKLADADAFRSLGLDRRQALWEVSALHDRPVALFAGQASESAREAQISLPGMTTGEHVIQDYISTALSLKAHPVSFVREKLQLLHVLSTKEIGAAQDGVIVKVAGLVLVRQRPGTAGGICFITIEDETGFSNLVVFEKLFAKYRREILQSRLLMVEGRLQREGEVIHVIVQHCYNVSGLLRHLSVPGASGSSLFTDAHPDGPASVLPAGNMKTKGNESNPGKIFPGGRNFK